MTKHVNKSDYYVHYQTVCAYCGEKFDGLSNVDAHHRFTALCDECYSDPERREATALKAGEEPTLREDDQIEYSVSTIIPSRR